MRDPAIATIPAPLIPVLLDKENSTAAEQKANGAIDLKFKTWRVEALFSPRASAIMHTPPAS
jgi:hypothetical protein